MQPEGTFKNGDLWYEERLEEDGKTFFIAHTDKIESPDDQPYETTEVPDRFPLFKMVIFPDGTPEAEVTEYLLARKIGDNRYSSDCSHEIVTNGRCKKCLRMVK